MTQIIINTGEVANDGTGESLRNAFDAVNDNFSNIWAAGPVDSQVVISNNVISTNETNLELILRGNGIGTVTLSSTTVPSIDGVYNLGNITRQFDSTYSRFFYGNGRFLTGITTGGSGGNVYFGATPPLDPQIGDIWIDSDTAVQYLYFSDNTSNQWAEMQAYQSFSSGGNGTADTGNWGFDGNNFYNLNGGNIFNGDLSHGYTAGITIPTNGDSNAILLNNTYGNIILQAGANSDPTATWIFGNNGVIAAGGNLKLQPDSANAGAYLDIFLTAGPDIHIAGNGETVILGTDEQANVAVNVDGNVSIQAGNVSGTQVWNFGTDGNLTLPRGGVVYETNIPDGGLNGNTIALKPSGGTNADQQLLIYPTVNDANHLHLTSGNLNNTELFLGDDNLYVKLANTGNVVINSNNGVGNTAQWTFGTDGRLINLEGLNLTAGGQFNICTILTGGSGYDTGSSLKATTGGSGIGMTVGIGYGLSNQLTNADVVDPGTGYVDGDVITVSGGTGGTFVITRYNDQANQANNNFIESNWVFGSDGVLTLPNADASGFGNIYFVENSSTITFGLDDNATPYLYSFSTSGITLPRGGATIRDTVGNSVAFGLNAGQSSQGIEAVAIGDSAGNVSQGGYAVAMGFEAGKTNQGAFSVAVGYPAGQTNQANSAVAVGSFAGATSQGLNAVAVGVSAGQTTQSNQAVAVGALAGANVQGMNSVAIGTQAGYETQGGQSVAIGIEAGKTTQGNNSVAIGTLAGNSSQSDNSVAIGTQAGQITQGQFAVAIGDNAGNNAQGTDAVAIGASAGLTTQGNGAVAFGQGAGETSQGNNALALGKAAGQVNQGINSVAIGQSAGLTDQGNNSIILNATGSALDQTIANTFTVAPVRNDVANTAEVMFYNTSSKEITYGNVISVAGNVTGSCILGNGSQLTNLPAPTVVQDISSNGAMSIMTYDGTIKYVNYATVEPSSGNITGGNILTSGLVSATGNITGNYFIGNGSQLSSVATQVTGSWTLAVGTNTVSLTVPGPGTYSIWVNGNIPNGIVTYTATVVVTNTNVPVVGTSYGWYYLAGNALVLTAIPDQIVGSPNTISTAVVATTTANVFTFGITNNSGSNQVVNYGYTKL